MTHRTILMLGSNMPDRRERLTAALQLLTEVCSCRGVSEPVVSADVSGLGPDYENIAVEADTALARADLSDFIVKIERRLGRTTLSKASGLMPIDIDMVIWDGEIVSVSDYSRPYFRTAMKSMRTQAAASI